METSRVYKIVSILMMVLFLLTVTAVAVNACHSIQKDRNDKKSNQDDSFKIKSHPVLKSPTGNNIYSTSQRWGPEGNEKTTSNGMSTMSLSTLRPKYYYNLTG
jgi:hypothetical protein